MEAAVSLENSAASDVIAEFVAGLNLSEAQEKVFGKRAIDNFLRKIESDYSVALREKAQEIIERCSHGGTFSLLHVLANTKLAFQSDDTWDSLYTPFNSRRFTPDQNIPLTPPAPSTSDKKGYQL